MSSVHSLSVSSPELEDVLSELQTWALSDISSCPHVDEALTQLAMWERNEDDDALALRWIEWLDKAIGSLNPASPLCGRALRRLRTLCRHTENLPASFDLKNDFTLEDPYPRERSPYSDVYQARRGNLIVALKSVRVHIDELVATKRAFRTEAVIWRCLRHPNVVPFLGVLEPTPKFQVCMVSQWMKNGTIVQFLKRNPNYNRLALIEGIITGLIFIHNLGMIHGDLKGANILVDEHQTARLADFGLTASLTNTAGHTSTAFGMGTRGYTAPELLVYDFGDERAGQPSVETDVYALGMVMWEMFALCPPFSGATARGFALDMQIVDHDLRPTRPDTPALADSVWDAIQMCWRKAPAKRPSLADLQAMIADT